jgi:hypothetical protein
LRRAFAPRLWAQGFRAALPRRASAPRLARLGSPCASLCAALMRRASRLPRAPRGTSSNAPRSAPRLCAAASLSGLPFHQSLRGSVKIVTRWNHEAQSREGVYFQGAEVRPCDWRSSPLMGSHNTDPSRLQRSRVSSSTLMGRSPLMGSHNTDPSRLQRSRVYNLPLEDKGQPCIAAACPAPLLSCLPASCR